MASSTTTGNNQSNTLVNETAGQHYMRQFVDYLDHGMDFPELSQIRQLDIYLQDYYRRIRELVENSRIKPDDQHAQPPSESQGMLMNALTQIKIIGDKKMQLSQQMLDATERQSKKLKIAHQKYLESINQQTFLSDNNSNEVDSENEYDSETGSQRSLSTKSLWKRKATNSTMSVKRKCVITSEQNDRSNNNERDRKKPIPRNLNANMQNNNNNSIGRRLRLNNDSSTSQPDETTYCLCSQLSYGSMILCDNRSCDIKWFHFNCVSLTTKPKGKWFCPYCRETRS